MKLLPLIRWSIELNVTGLENATKKLPDPGLQPARILVSPVHVKVA